MKRWLCACGHDLMPSSLKYAPKYILTLVYLKEILQSAYRTFCPKQRQTEVNWQVKLELLIIMLITFCPTPRKKDLPSQEHVHVSLNIERFSPTKFKFKEARAVLW